MATLPKIIVVLPKEVMQWLSTLPQKDRERETLIAEKSYKKILDFMRKDK